LLSSGSTRQGRLCKRRRWKISNLLPRHSGLHLPHSKEAWSLKDIIIDEHQQAAPQSPRFPFFLSPGKKYRSPGDSTLAGESVASHSSGLDLELGTAKHNQGQHPAELPTVTRSASLF